MRLLVSVTGAAEARSAAGGGADVLDVKDPREGALGAPAPDVLRAVVAVADGRPVSVALGDLPHVPHTGALAAAGAAAHAPAFVKAGLRGSGTIDEAVALLRAIRHAVPDTVAVVGAAYADAERLDGSPLPPRLLPAAARAAGIDGCLVDTAVKDGSGLLRWLDHAALTALAAEAHAAGLTFGLAGQLRLDELGPLAATGADLVGVRSAVCQGGRRDGTLSPQLVARAADACRPLSRR